MDGDKGKIFSEEEVEVLLAIFSDDDIQRRLQSNQRSHVGVWVELAERLSTLGYPRSASQVKDKVNNLRRRYLGLKRGMRSGDSPPEWVHWDVLHKLYATAPAGTPEARMDSLISSQVISSDDGGPSTSAGPSTPAAPATPLISRRKRRSEADITTYLRS
ncbi:uncharacterized protein LOC124171165 [Ischnura elegans]|uniref:uncharacterized protein LOC124171165 n=1 Tax=Ischnura elegans TaxID=197161 RepID=UPI001ED8B6B1|nr:uncharacterized protein LOC124171165 [Ischnura elegans]